MRKLSINCAQTCVDPVCDAGYNLPQCTQGLCNQDPSEISYPHYPQISLTLYPRNHPIVSTGRWLLLPLFLGGLYTLSTYLITTITIYI